MAPRREMGDLGPVLPGRAAGFGDVLLARVSGFCQLDRAGRASGSGRSLREAFRAVWLPEGPAANANVSRPVGCVKNRILDVVFAMLMQRQFRGNVTTV